MGDSRFAFCLIGEKSVYMLYLYFFLFNLELDVELKIQVSLHTFFRDNLDDRGNSGGKKNLHSLLRGHARPELSLWYHGGSCQCCKPFGFGGPHRARETAEALCEYGEGAWGELGEARWIRVEGFESNWAGVPGQAMAISIHDTQRDISIFARMHP